MSHLHGHGRLLPALLSLVRSMALLAGMGGLLTPGHAAKASAAVATAQRWEHALESTNDYRNPFKDVTVAVTYTGPGGRVLRSLGFWDGGTSFKLRCAFPTPGTWSWHTSCSNPTDTGLHGRHGEIQVTAYDGPNPLYRHGFLRVSDNRRSLAHADGTPFLWIGDTHWAATTLLSERGFRRWVDDRAAKAFTVLQTNIARCKASPLDAEGNAPWEADRWNVTFMRKLDREFDYANDKGLVLFVSALIDLKWDLKIDDYPRLVQMIAARYYAHCITYSSSMDDGFSTEQDEISELIDRVTDRHLLTQHTGTSSRDPAKYYDRAYLDYCMNQSGHHGGDYEEASKAAVEWHLALYNREPHKPVVNGEAWYEGMATPEQAVQMGYLSLLSGCCGYTFGANECLSGDSKLDALLNRKGAIYMASLGRFFRGIDYGRCLVPCHALIRNPKAAYRDRCVLARTQDGTTYVAFLPHGGEIELDLTRAPGELSAKWFNAISGQYGPGFSVTGGGPRSFVSEFASSMSLLVLKAKG